MKVLASFTGIEALKGLSVVITHRKPSGTKEEQIKKELVEIKFVRLVQPHYVR